MDGQVEACTGGEFVCGSLAVTLLINYLDGNPIKDADGTAPYFDNLTQFMVTSENAEAFYEFLSDENLATHTISDEEYQNLLVRNNPDVDYDYFYEMCIRDRATTARWRGMPTCLSAPIWCRAT